MSLDKRTWIDAALLVFVVLVVYILATFIQDWLNLPPANPSPVQSSPVPRSQTIVVTMSVPTTPACAVKHGTNRTSEGAVRYLHAVLQDLVDSYDGIREMRSPDTGNDYLCWMSPRQQAFMKNFADEFLFVWSEVMPQLLYEEMKASPTPF